MKLKSSIDPNSEAFAKNAAHHRGLAQQLRERAATIALGGPEEARARHTKRNKLLPRERVERLLDPGAPFLEVGALAAYDLYNGEAPAAGARCTPLAVRSSSLKRSATPLRLSACS